jgi:hypothetical protein
MSIWWWSGGVKDDVNMRPLKGLVVQMLDEWIV